MRNILWILLVAGCASEPDPAPVVAPVYTDWTFQPGRGFVRGDQVLSEQDFLDVSRKTAEQVRHGQAAGMFDLLIRNAQFPTLMQDAYFGRGQSLLQLNNLEAAYANYQQYLQKFPASERDSEAKRQLFETARLMASTTDVKGGISRLKRSLEAYPHEDFSPQYAFWMAEYYFKEDKIDEAQVEYLFIVEQYRDHPVVPAAMFKLGECELKHYHGIRFESRILLEAEKWYVRVDDEFPRTDIAKAARQRRAYVHEQLAAKEYETGRFYEGKGYDDSAVPFYKNILAKYAKTSSAAKARERLVDLGVKLDEGK